MSTTIGQTIGQYQLEELAGRGSMADVYKARHTVTGEVCAIKTIHPHLFNHGGSLDRFRREAEVMKRIHHPNIVRVEEFVVDGDNAYIVMEYLGGGTLELRLMEMARQRRPVSLEQADQWMQIICAAVDFAHRHGVIHRDLKPANIMFRDDGTPVLTDFGLVYWIDHPRLSGTGGLTGTPAYISPEQARGAPGDKRSDVYTLGVILYEMLVGQTPFQGGTLAVAVKHISELPPTPRVLGRHLPPGVESVVMRTLSKDPMERYQSAQLLAHALHVAVERAQAQPAARSEPDPTEPVPVRSSSASLPSSARSGTPLEEFSAYEDSEYAAPPSPRDRRAWLAPAAVLLGIVVLVVGIGWGATQLIEVSTPTANTAPRFAVGSGVRVDGDGQASVSLLRGCPAGFWLGVLGVANDGDVGRILERRTCDGAWWYRLSIPEAADAEWDGTGWIAETYLHVR